METTIDSQFTDEKFIIPEIASIQKEAAEMLPENSFKCIAGAILMHLYECMKNDKDPEEVVIGPEALGISPPYWAKVLGLMAGARMIYCDTSFWMYSDSDEPAEIIKHITIGGADVVCAVETQLFQAHQLEIVRDVFSGLFK